VEKLKKERPFGELGDILMASLHLVEPGRDFIELPDLYSSGNVRIALKKDLSAPANAEWYYRQGKRRAAELERLKKLLVLRSSELQSLVERGPVAQPDKHKTASRGRQKKNASKNEVAAKPFHEFTIDGYRLIAGKNARSNDLILRQHSKPDDLWFHAADVPGSHVILSLKRDVEPNPGLIEKAAALAAHYSSAKNQSLANVHYTRVKFVRKKKGMPAGMVSLLRNESILVKPHKPSVNETKTTD
jgi:predicted ribosome quality control (RQC) complex YloA/Tae2 family protein